LANLKESLGKLSLFLLCVVIIAISIGMLISRLGLEVHVARNVVMVVSIAAAIGSYMATYRPGWLYKSLVDISKEDR